MPKGVPVATVAIGKAGAINAGYLAAQMLSTGNEELAKKVKNLREEQKEALKRKTRSFKAKLLRKMIYAYPTEGVWG